MNIDINLSLAMIIVFISIIQSFFGVGVLLFGTPLLLLLEYPFLESLLILLPISMSINLIQIVKYYKDIDIDTYKSVLFLSIPFIIIFLFITSKSDININVIVGLFLILVASKEYISFFNIYLEKMFHFNKTFYILMGIIHGVTNLGGALLTTKVFTLDINKYQKRATIAISYITFALFQIITILFLDIKYQAFNLVYIGIGIFVYFIIDWFAFNKIKEFYYNKLFSLMLTIIGLLLLVKEIKW